MCETLGCLQEMLRGDQWGLKGLPGLDEKRDVRTVGLTGCWTPSPPLSSADMQPSGSGFSL